MFYSMPPPMPSTSHSCITSSSYCYSPLRLCTYISCRYHDVFKDYLLSSTLQYASLPSFFPHFSLFVCSLRQFFVLKFQKLLWYIIPQHLCKHKATVEKSERMIFKGLKIALDVSPAKEKQKFTQLIKDHGGEITFLNHKVISHLTISTSP